MSRAARPRGGILWDLFLIAVVCAGALALWATRERWRSRLPVFSRGSAAPAPAGEDLSKQSAAVQADVRAFLAETGVAERDILKTYNAERSDGAAVWLESTLELRAAPGFHSGEFLKRVLPLLQRRGLAVVTDEAAGDRWLLELGEGERVFQRLVFRTGTGPVNGRSAGKG